MSYFCIKTGRSSQPTPAGRPLRDLRHIPRLFFVLLALNVAAPRTGSTEESDAVTPEETELDPWAGAEEMLVYGQGGQGISLDAGMSVTAYDASDLVSFGVEKISDLAKFTPNLEIRTAGSTSAALFIRGVGLNDFTANGAGAVAVYQDDIALNLPAIQLGQIFDTSDVQILKGPQGSGSGRNASAGAIKSYSRKPTGEYAANLRIDYGNFDFVDTEGALELPILGDTLAGRFAFRLTQRDGIIRNRCGELSAAEALRPTACGSSASQEIPPGLERDLNDIGTWAIRGTLRFVPQNTDLDMEWLLSLHFGRVDQLGTVGQAIGANEGELGIRDLGGYVSPEITAERNAIEASLPPPPSPPILCIRDPSLPGCDSQFRAATIRSRRLARRPLDTEPFEGDYNLPGHERQSSWGGYLRGEWAIDTFTLTSITGYEYYVRDRLLDSDYGPNTLFEFEIGDKAWQATQELRLGEELEAFPVSWELGAYALFEELDYDQLTLPGVAAQLFKIDQVYEQKTASIALYGEFIWEFADDFELEAGARYNWERKEMDADVEVQTNPLCTTSGRDIPGPLYCRDVVTFDHPTGTLKLQHFLSSDVSVFGKYSHGWKGPQFNVRDGTTTLGALDVAGPEKIDAIEFGFNGEWLDGLLVLHGAMFWYSYQDYQVFVFSNELGIPPQRTVVNADDAQLYGAELEAKIEPIERLVLDVRFGWLEGKFLDFTRTSRRQLRSSQNSPPLVIQQVQDYNGNRLPNTPRFKVSLSLEYTWELARFGSLIPRYDLSWTDDVYFDQSEGRGSPSVTGVVLPDFAIGQRQLALHNLRLTYRSPDEHLEIAGWVRNVTNEVYKTFAYDASQAVRLVGNLVGDPRTYGLSASFRF